MECHGSIPVEWVDSIHVFGRWRKVEWADYIRVFGWRVKMTRIWFLSPYGEFTFHMHMTKIVNKCAIFI